MINVRLFGAIFTTVFTWMAAAEAYIDPGTGSLIWQLLLAAFFGLMFYVSRIKRWIVSILGRRK